MKQDDWESEKARLLATLGKMEAWTATLLQSVEEAKNLIEKSADGFLFEPESHPIGVLQFEMAMRDVDSPLQEIVAIWQAIYSRYREP